MWIQELQKLSKEKLIPFIGAGFSKNVNYPDWEDFMRNELQRSLKDRFNITIDLNSTFLTPTEAVEFYIWNVGRKLNPFDTFNAGKSDFRDRLLKCFDKFKEKTNDKELWEQHFLLVQKFKTLYTTNWDNALEIACMEKIGGYTQLYSQERKLIRCKMGENSDERFIIKFHGTYEDKSARSIIACRTDYYNRILLEGPLDFKFKQDLINRNFLFIGYSFQDPNINYVLDQIRLLTQGEFRTLFMKESPKLFWITTEHLNTYQKEFYEKWYNIYPVYIFREVKDNKLKQFKKDLTAHCNKCPYNIYRCNSKEEHDRACYECEMKISMESQKRKLFKKQILYLLKRI